MSWDEFQIVGELQEQNQNLLLQLDAKERELREVQIYLSKIQVRRFPRPSARSFARSLSLEVFVWSDAFLPAYDDDDRPQTSEAREGKILELAKKNRALNVAIEREKSRVVRLQSEIERIRKSTSPRKGS